MDPRKVLERITDAESYDSEEINELVNFFGGDKKYTCKGKSVFQKADLQDCQQYFIT